jgi:hypothetical protein
VALVAVAAASVAFLVLGGDDEASPARDTPPVAEVSPVDAAQAYLDAAERADCAGMVDALTEESWSPHSETADEAVDECRRDLEQDATQLDGIDFGAVELVSEEGDAAVVTVEATVDGATTSRELPLRRIDGAWKVHLAGASDG